MDPIYFNFYSFGSLLAALFSAYAAFFFLGIKDRSKAALNIGIATLITTFYHSAYAVGFSSYDEWTIFHRWFMIPIPLISLIHLFLFFFYFPEPQKEKIGLILFGIQYLGILIVTGFYVTVSLRATRTFVFGSHHWDFQTPLFYKIFSLIVLIYIICLIAAGVWRAVVEKGKQRRAVIYILLSYCFLSIFSGIMNALSRDGTVSRAAYQQCADLTLVAGYFIMIVLYINITKERTTILSRIVGVAMATFLLVFQLVGYAILNGYESSFDTIQTKTTRLVVLNGERPDDLSYLVSFDPETSKIETEFGSKDKRTGADDKDELRMLYYKSKLIRLGNLKGDQRWERSSEIIRQDPKHFSVYRAGLREFLLSKGSEIVSDEVVHSFFIHLESKLRVIRSKFYNSPQKNDKSLASKLFVSKEPGVSATLESFSKIFLSEVESGKNGEEMNNIFLSTLIPIREEGERIYRGIRTFRPGDERPKYYVSYIYTHPKTGIIYEAGFDYKSLRRYLHQPALILVVSLLSIVFVTAVGFRLFFKGALLTPLDNIVIGLREVNSGNLDYRLVPHVEDEIGFIARSFNRMTLSIKAARARLEQYAAELEGKVKERTRELEHTLDEIKELKQQQDGDYFLTSLLIRPLGENKATQEKVKVDFFLEQKKKFSFRNYEEEIGGDMNIANHIELKNRSFTVFLNADAMGKSMQGAGGALVLGAVFESIIERTRLIGSIRLQSPEYWLKSAFTELHKVFESFDGSMLVSLVMGLVDDQSGILYYINAEHPWTVLYRDGIASFIENELLFRKLGTTGLEGRVFIKTFQLEPGDVIIAGSDGRDDILLSTDEMGGRILNDDEQLFLKLVEEGGGDLKRIYERILSRGPLTDDLSMIRLSFSETNEQVSAEEAKEKEKIKKLLVKVRKMTKSDEMEEAISFLEEADTLNNRVPEVKKNFIQLYLKVKNYREAARYAEDYLDLKPIDNDILYIASFAARKAGLLRKALNFGERLRLREPSHLKNLINLAQIYIVFKKFDEAASTIRFAIELSPENSTIMKIKDLLDRLVEKQESENL
ncbi:SpoIIE-like protein phosphatase domain protein [Leptospira broomii serovar Hurstbridge str. 5399]|uniref:SpoIIE-like protein phosphatase domain protein n=1 Tax=Leptospira broomii serovar Hurstbridge str. 5399 TaxID=1049789 RepID=T0F6I8_9LEPT|nr:SpoIIE family protein phosphatase [Leptospira broomii]EQA43521.1 SpoIIE-like protein phosphatase domain protein [Leptospira broomii serovar Hurstbridge str. 5399]